MTLIMTQKAGTMRLCQLWLANTGPARLASHSSEWAGRLAGSLLVAGHLDLHGSVSIFSDPGFQIRSEYFRNLIGFLPHTPEVVNLLPRLAGIGGIATLGRIPASHPNGSLAQNHAEMPFFVDCGFGESHVF